MRKDLRTIVVGCAALSDQDDRDASGGLDPVVEPAARLAASLGATLHVVHAYDLPEQLLSALHDRGASGPEDGRTYAAAVEEKLTCLTAELARSTAMKRHAVHGSAGAGVVKVAGEVGADLIVVGATRGGRMRSAILGTTATRVLRSAKVPVLVMRRPFYGPIQRVVLATDICPGAESVYEREMDALASLVAGPELAVRVLHVVELDPMLPSPAPRGELTAIAQELLKKFVAERHARPFAPEPLVRVGDVAPEVAREVEEWNADLLVLGSQCSLTIIPGGLGGAATATIRNVGCNVLVAPADPLGLDLQDEPILMGRALFDDEE